MVGDIIRNIRILWMRLNALVVSVRHVALLIDAECSVKCNTGFPCESCMQHFCFNLK